MTDAPAPARLTERRFLERTVAFSDGVAAIAITLLVLPLVELEPPDLGHGESVWTALAANSDALIAFAVTFLVIASLWFAHARVFGNVARADSAVAWLNMAYLLAIVTLPFASSWLQDDGFAGGVGTFYLLVLWLASGALWSITWHTARHPELLTDEARADEDQRRGPGAFFACYFLVGAALAWWWPDVTGWYLLALWPAVVLWERFRRHRVVGAPRAARPASSRATGTRNGEQET